MKAADPIDLAKRQIQQLSDEIARLRKEEKERKYAANVAVGEKAIGKFYRVERHGGTPSFVWNEKDGPLGQLYIQHYPDDSCFYRQSYDTYEMGEAINNKEATEITQKAFLAEVDKVLKTLLGGLEGEYIYGPF